ncbi:group III truncated hemoglobin [Mesonia ostreae]|uniref:Group III truncated hemoglobin n=1 Tax=Mesonia ostreae TaxID=861110 RepID=A0ABU2KL61_9FLAO|nr:group III truncated hemoglobin [Mesonia ostreae]MDT0295438.1 group III truncated hemoglobin [Mesonia ostreae]
MENLKIIEDREDVSLLVHKFYEKVRLNEEIGHFFNETIDDWDEHLEKLTDFWESNLFRVNKFTGRPGYAHIKVDQKFNHSIEAKHFGVWLNLWFETIDTYFEGELADKAKYFARNLGSNFHMKIFAARG